VAVLLGSWNGRDRVPGLAVIGDGYLDPALSLAGSVIVDDPSNPDAETGFLCVATTNRGTEMTQPPGSDPVQKLQPVTFEQVQDDGHIAIYGLH